jgi:hypothetical protein
MENINRFKVWSGLVVAALISQSTSAAVIISVGYYDTEHASPTTPNPWSGSPNTTFFGFPDANGIWDTGAILLFNQGPGNVIVSPGLKVDGFANGASFQSWDGDIGSGFNLLSGQRVIFAGHGSGTFDTSDQPIITDQNLKTNDRPQIHVKIGGIQYQFSDTGQVLNTGGFDPGETTHTSESLPWTLVGQTPEPTGAVVGVGMLWAFSCRRRLKKAGA